MNLFSCKPDALYRVISLDGGPQFKMRLGNLGVAEGKIIRKIHNHPFRGPITVKVANTELAIGYGMAEKIDVEELA